MLWLGLVVIVTVGHTFSAPVSQDFGYDFDLSRLGAAIYRIPEDYESAGELVSAWMRNGTTHGNPEELGYYVEGDIHQPSVGRNAMRLKSSRWKNARVPYVLSDDFSLLDLAMIFGAFFQFRQKTCVRFVPYNGEKDFVSIEAKSTGCWSTVGRAGGKQILNLQPYGCLYLKGTVLHELMHTLGFLHEHTRHDRDRYVSVNYDNIQTASVGNFERETEKKTTTVGMKYDLGSVMHYSPTAFSKNGLPTIVPKVKFSGEMGQRAGFSSTDIKKINKLYCNDD